MIAGLAQREWLIYNIAMPNKGTFKKGNIPWNKGTKGVMKPNKTSFKKGDGFIPLNIRFWEKVKKTDNCWYWLGSKNNKGYGRINTDGFISLAHRVSFEIKNGKIQDSLDILHKCDNPACVNPEHLWAGTHKENMQDMNFKGRRIKGEQASWSKLTQKEVDEIRNLYKEGKYSQRFLGKKFNISQTVIFDIIHNNLWKI